MIRQPFFSVVTPCYNHGSFLEETLVSVKAQSFADWECLVVDDASTDHSPDVAGRLASVDPRIRLVRHERNQGLAATRNTAIRQALGRYIVFLDADDLLLPETFETLRQAMARHGGDASAEQVWCMPFHYFRDGSRRARSVRSRTVSGLGSERQANLCTLACSNPLPVCSALVPAALAREIGGFDSGLRCLEDYEFWVRLAARGVSFRVLAHEGGEWGPGIRIHGENMSGNLRSMYRQEVRLRWQWDAQGVFSAAGAAETENRRRLLNRAARLLLLALVDPSVAGRLLRRDAWAAMHSPPNSTGALLGALLRGGVGLSIGRLIQRFR